VGQRAHLKERQSCAALQCQRLLEVAPCLLETRGPQLRDPEFLQRDGAYGVAEIAHRRRRRRQCRLHRCHRLLHEVEIGTSARESKPDRGQVEVKARPTLVGDGVSQLLAEIDVGGRVLESRFGEERGGRGECQLRVRCQSLWRKGAQ